MLSARLLVHISTLMLHAYSNRSKYFLDPVLARNSGMTY